VIRLALWPLILAGCLGTAEDASARADLSPPPLCPLGEGSCDPIESLNAKVESPDTRSVQDQGAEAPPSSQLEGSDRMTISMHTTEGGRHFKR
jgi:hypothetical protein